MLEEIDQASAELRNTSAGWVTRRDAAELLGKAATMSLNTLHDHRDEMDVDVRRSVDKALSEASAALQGVEPAPPPARKYSLQELAHACARPGAREVEPHGDGFAVVVQMKDGRTQKVYLQTYERKDHIEIVRVFTYCGVYSDDVAKWALRANLKLIQGSLGISEDEGVERFVLITCFHADMVTPREMKTAVKEIAIYGDWVENRLSGQDDF